MSLSSLIVQAGRHFSDKLNMDVSRGSTTRRELASNLAWTIISMVKPVESGSRLVVSDPRDSDVKRLCSEILGVGAALELVRSQGLVDGRTIKKIGKRFDFQARELGGKGTILIEAKGTFRGQSVDRQRDSFFDKLPPHVPRGYNRFIGVIFATWINPVKRGFDVEILDPAGERTPAFEQTVREVIRFYARRLDEVVGKPQAAARLFSLANSRQLFGGGRLPVEQFDERRQRRIFSRATMILRRPALVAQQEFWGGFWESAAVVVPPIASMVAKEQYSFAYTGIDSTVIRYILERRFDELLAYTQETDKLFIVSGADDFRSHFLLDEYGILRGWMNKIPEDQIEFDVRE